MYIYVYVAWRQYIRCVFNTRVKCVLLPADVETFPKRPREIERESEKEMVVHTHTQGTFPRQAFGNTHTQKLLSSAVCTKVLVVPMFAQLEREREMESIMAAAIATAAACFCSFYSTLH